MSIDPTLLKSYKDHCGPEVIDELVYYFQTEVPQKLKVAAAEVEAHNSEALKGTLHSLKNSFVNIGALDEGNLCQKIEDEVDHSSDLHLKSSLNRIAEAYDTVQQDLQVVLKSI